MPKNPVSLSCYFANARSVRNKLSVFQSLLEENLNVIGLCETYLQPSDNTSLLLANFANEYKIFRGDRPSNLEANVIGGGVLLCCRTSLGPVSVDIPEKFSNLEVVCIDLLLSEKVRIVCAYRPPSYQAGLTRLFCECVSFLVSNTSYPVIVLSDINLPQMNWSTLCHPSTEIYSLIANMCFQNSLAQLVLEPTRLGNLLDVVLCNEPRIISGLYVDECFGSSDHNAVRFNILNTITVAENNHYAWDF